MARTRRGSWGPVIRPLVFIVLMLVVAFIFRGSVVMTAALVLGLVGLAFLLIALFTHLPAPRNRK